MAPFLLALAIVGALRPPRRVPAWAIPLACAVVVVALGLVHLDELPDLLRPLAAPLAFLLVAVPFAVLLGQTGLIDRVALTLARRADALWMLWCLAALVTMALNLDTAIVLLTPIYLRVAKLLGRDPVSVALIPAVLALLASSLLPVSNLTNLIAVETFHLSTAGFLANLALPTVVAVAVGWFCYRWAIRSPEPVPRAADLPDVEPPDVEPPALDLPDLDASATVGEGPGLRFAVVVLALAVVGLVLGPVVGIDPWMVVLVADLALLTRRGSLPWRRLPVDLVVLVLALAVCSFATADALGLGDLDPGNSLPELTLTLFGSAVSSNLVNNLPAFLVGRTAIAGGGDCQVWALLLGSNLGPGIALSGALSTLLWVSIVRAGGHEVTATRFARLGAVIVVPALFAAAAVFLAKAATLGC